MLTDGRFWIGVGIGAVGYHFYMRSRAKKA